MMEEVQKDKASLSESVFVASPARRLPLRVKMVHGYHAIVPAYSKRSDAMVYSQSFLTHRLG